MKPIVIYSHLNSSKEYLQFLWLEIDLVLLFFTLWKYLAHRLPLAPLTATAANAHGKEVDQFDKAQAGDAHEEAEDAATVRDQRWDTEQNGPFDGSELMLLKENC